MRTELVPYDRLLEEAEAEAEGVDYAITTTHVERAGRGAIIRLGASGGDIEVHISGDECRALLRWLITVSLRTCSST